jgi:hypothetical protein
LGGLIITNVGSGEVGVGLLDADRVHELGLCDNPSQTEWVDIVYRTEIFAGKNVKIELKVKTDSQLSSSVFVDEVRYERYPYYQSSNLVSIPQGYPGRNVIDLKIYQPGTEEYDKFMKEFGER